jgi:DNA-binding MarR family transcriptional regulator
MDSLKKLFALREYVREYENDIGIAHLTEIERSVVAFIAAHKETTLKQITEAKYFQNISSSSLKMAVAKLIKEKIISQKVALEDKRSKFLSVNL